MNLSAQCYILNVQNVNNCFLEIAYSQSYFSQGQINKLYLTSSSKTMSILVLKKVQCSIGNTALTMMGFFGITESYFQTFLLHTREVFRGRCTTGPKIQLIGMAIQSSLKRRSLFLKMFLGSIKDFFQFFFNFKDNQWQKL